jgi:endonuclease YncB( thermonuclease family)
MVTTLLSLFVLVALIAGPPPAGVTTDNAKCVRVVDGDTVDIEVRYVVRVRLATCWAPERRTVAGEKAWEDLELHASGKPCVLHIPTQGARSFADVSTLGRVVGHVWLKDSDESLSAWQVRRKNAATEKGKPLGE